MTPGDDQSSAAGALTPRRGWCYTKTSSFVERTTCGAARSRRRASTTAECARRVQRAVAADVDHAVRQRGNAASTTACRRRRRHAAGRDATSIPMFGSIASCCSHRTSAAQHRVQIRTAHGAWAREAATPCRLTPPRVGEFEPTATHSCASTRAAGDDGAGRAPVDAAFRQLHKTRRPPLHLAARRVAPARRRRGATARPHAPRHRRRTQRQLAVRLRRARGAATLPRHSHLPTRRSHASVRRAAARCGRATHATRKQRRLIHQWRPPSRPSSAPGRRRTRRCARARRASHTLADVAPAMARGDAPCVRRVCKAGVRGGYIW
jgi:hypothetical protein